MAEVRVRIKMDKGAVDRLLFSPTGPIAQDLVRRGIRGEAVAKRDAPVDTGRLRASINHVLIYRGGRPVMVVGTNVVYALHVHRGTGIYGPRRRPIKPKRAQRLVFTPRGAARPVFARQVRGSPPRPFLKNALIAGAQ